MHSYDFFFKARTRFMKKHETSLLSRMSSLKNKQKLWNFGSHSHEIPKSQPIIMPIATFLLPLTIVIIIC